MSVTMIKFPIKYRIPATYYMYIEAHYLVPVISFPSIKFQIILL